MNHQTARRAHHRDARVIQPQGLEQRWSERLQLSQGLAQVGGGQFLRADLQQYVRWHIGGRSGCRRRWRRRRGEPGFCLVQQGIFQRLPLLDVGAGMARVMSRIRRK